MRTGELESAAATAAAMSAPSAAAAAAEDAAGKVAGGDGERVLRRSVASLQANLEVLSYVYLCHPRGSRPSTNSTRVHLTFLFIIIFFSSS